METITAKNNDSGNMECMEYRNYVWHKNKMLPLEAKWKQAD